MLVCILAIYYIVYLLDNYSILAMIGLFRGTHSTVCPLQGPLNFYATFSSMVFVL